MFKIKLDKCLTLRHLKIHLLHMVMYILTETSQVLIQTSVTQKTHWIKYPSTKITLNKTSIYTTKLPQEKLYLVFENFFYFLIICCSFINFPSCEILPNYFSFRSISSEALIICNVLNPNPRKIILSPITPIFWFNQSLFFFLLYVAH